jgi:hypothetical protein
VERKELLRISYEKLFESKPENLRRLARHLNLSEEGNQEELANRVFDGIQGISVLPLLKSEAQRKEYEDLWAEMLS